MDGRVKTLHPKIHGGLLGRRGVDDAVMAQHGIAPDRPAGGEPLPVRRHRGASRLQLRGRPSRTSTSAARRCCARPPRTTSRCWWSWIRPTTRSCWRSSTRTRVGATFATRARLAAKAFAHTARYDTMVAAAILACARASTGSGDCSDAFPPTLPLGYREGAGPALRREPAPARGLLPRAGRARRQRRHGARAAGQGPVVQQHCRRGYGDRVRAAVRRPRLRHRQARQSVRGSARRRRLLEAYERAYRTDPTSAFGGIIAFNRELDARHRRARSLERQFVEVLAAPAVDRGGRRRCSPRSPNVRVLVLGESAGRDRGRRSSCAASPAACCAQTRDLADLPERALERATRRKPSAAELADLQVRLARVQVREIQRHRVCARRHATHRRGRRADEPRLLDAPRRDEGGGREAGRGRGGHGLGCLLAVPRQSRRGRRLRHPRRHPARRQQARRARSSRPPTSTTWPWCLPACATSATGHCP